MENKETPVTEPEVAVESEPLALVMPMPTGRLLDVPSIVDEVFDAWRGATKKNARTILTPKRRKVIEARVKEGYELADLVDAVQGWRYSAFHTGRNDAGTVYNELTMLLRDGEQVEKFRDLQRNPPRRPQAQSARGADKVAMIADHFGVGNG